MGLTNGLKVRIQVTTNNSKVTIKINYLHKINTWFNVLCLYDVICWTGINSGPSLELLMIILKATIRKK